MKKKVMASIVGVGVLCGGLGTYAGTVIDQYKTVRGNTAIVEKEEIHKNLVAVEVDGKQVKTDTWSANGVSYVPLREVSNLLGAEVNWDQSTQTAKITSKGKTPPSTTGDLGKNRSNAAKINQKVVVENDDWLDGSQKFEVSLTEVIDGQEALDIIKEVNPYNDDPKPGQKYVLAKFKINVLDLENEPMQLFHHDFDAVSSKGVMYSEFISIVEPEPSINTKLYNDSEHEGWTYFMVDENDSPKVVFRDSSDAEAWFDLGL